MKCTACDKELIKKDTVFTEGKAPFCNNPFECNDMHPNSAAAIVSRGGAIKMYSEADLDNVLFSNLNVPEKTKERIIKVATKPQSIRLSKMDIASYLVQLQEEHEMASLSEAIRYCVNIAMQVAPNPIHENRPERIEPSTFVVNNEPTPEPEPEVEQAPEPEKEPEPEPVEEVEVF